MKIIDIQPGDDFDIIQQEILMMQDCKHPNIVQYIGSYFRRGKLWIAMELCSGGSLQDIYTITGKQQPAPTLSAGWRKSKEEFKQSIFHIDQVYNSQG